MAAINEDLIREIALMAKNKLGDNASKENILSVVEKVVNDMESNTSTATYGHYRPSDPAILSSDRIIVSVFGANKPGLINGITAVLAELNCDILDISQKFVENLFYMIMVVDISTSPANFVDVKERLIQRGEELNSKVYVQNEDVFRYVNRL